MERGSACSSATLKPSHVLAAMGYAPERVHSSIRLGLGRFTTDEEVRIAASRIAERVSHIRSFSDLDLPPPPIETA